VGAGLKLLRPKSCVLCERTPPQGYSRAGAPSATVIVLPTRMTALVILKPFLDDLPWFDI